MTASNSPPPSPESLAVWPASVHDLQSKVKSASQFGVASHTKESQSLS